MYIKSNKGVLSLPGSIIIAGALIALALILINKPAKTDKQISNIENKTEDATATIPAVSSSDHIFGNPNAPIKLIEYSDPSCPYCKIYNVTLTSLMDTYGPTGKVAWVYRQFPLFKPIEGEIPHPNALSQAMALECIGALGGNKAFFAFEKKWFASLSDSDVSRTKEADRTVIDKIAKEVGINTVSFNECMTTERFRSKIDADYELGIKLGINGTPLTVIITPSGNMIPLVGAQSYATLKSTIDTLITTIATSTTIKN